MNSIYIEGKYGVRIEDDIYDYRQRLWIVDSSAEEINYLFKKIKIIDFIF